MLQPNAVACITVSCADYQRPLTAELRHANRTRLPVPTAPMRPLRGLANATVACVALAAGSGAVAIPIGKLGGSPAPATKPSAHLTAGLSVNDWPIPLNGSTTPTNPFAGLSTAWAVTDLLIFGVALLGALFFGAWLFQARRNLDALPAANPFWAKSWTLGVWFVPAGNAAMPALVMEDVARNTVAADPTDLHHPRLIWVARTWWIACVVMLFLLYVLSDHKGAAAGLVVVTMASVLVAAAGCIAYVRLLSALQVRRFEPIDD